MRKWMWFTFSAMIIIADQLSKSAVISHLEPYQSYTILPMLNFTLAYNTGAAFSFLSQTGGWHHWFFIVFTAIVSIVLCVWMIRLPNKSAYMQFAAISFILGGALANLIDRINKGYVVDFIDVYYKNYHWPIFNVADCAITVGTIMLAYTIYSGAPTRSRL
jgi:signal peptidase II